MSSPSSTTRLGPGNVFLCLNPGLNKQEAVSVAIAVNFCSVPTECSFLVSIFPRSMHVLIIVSGSSAHLTSIRVQLPKYRRTDPS